MESRTKYIITGGLTAAIVIIASIVFVVLFSLPPPGNGGPGGPTRLQWTWVLGNYSRENPGTYGTQGVADVANVPGARTWLASCTDASGNFWLFGGAGIDNASLSGKLNDLWMFNVGDSTWTWMSGNYSRNNLGTYGTKGVADAANVPGARDAPVCWSDASGNIWLFGGYGYNNVSGIDLLNDLWRFNVSDSTWTWVSGNYSANNPGTYGTKGVADAANVPGARDMPNIWVDADGNFWLFGGDGYDNASLPGELNDLWRFNVSDSTWTWVSGNYSANNPGTYGTKGVADTANVPGGRFAPSSWMDASGNLWLFGGEGYDNASLLGVLNDLWMFNVTDLTWTWMSGNYSRNNLGTYGTKGVADAANMPGGRHGSPSWMDASGDYWIFGGRGYDNISGPVGYLNDFWKYDVTDSTWTWVSGNYSADNPGTYGTKGVADATNVPGARYLTAFWMGASGDIWLFGGEGPDNASLNGALNDLWKFQL